MTRSGPAGVRTGRRARRCCPPCSTVAINISAGGSGQDYGYFNDPAVNAQIDAAYKITDQAAREKAWGDVDEAIQKQAAVIPLGSQKFTFIHGSGVKNFQTNTAFGGLRGPGEHRSEVTASRVGESTSCRPGSTLRSCCPRLIEARAARPSGPPPGEGR